MKIVIAGAGAIGTHLAKLLSYENQDITLIDNDAEALRYASTKLDVLTIKGDATHLHVLREAEVNKASLFISVTTSETTNLLTALLAKQKGAKRTVARVSHVEYISDEQREYFATVGIDSIFSPDHLAALEIERLVGRASLTDTFDFEDGKISVVGFTIDGSSTLVGRSIAHIWISTQNAFNYRGVALLRNHQTIIPKNRTILQKGDHLYLSIATKDIEKVLPFVGKESKAIKKIMLIGDTALALRTAELLEKKYKVTVVMPDKERGKEFLEQLRTAMITIADPSSIEVLEQEGLPTTDAFIALTPDSEINILSSLIAEDRGVYKTIALVNNEAYTRISQNIGVDTLINKKLIAANNIFRYVRKGSVEAITAMHGVDAEIIEFAVKKENQLTRKSLTELKLPSGSIVAGVIRGTETYIPGGDFNFQKGDKVIVFAKPESIHRIEKFFK